MPVTRIPKPSHGFVSDAELERQYLGEAGWQTVEAESGPQPTRECTLEANTTNLVGGRITWDKIYDFDNNEAAEIPADIGMERSVDLARVTATEAGIWIFKLVFNPTADVTAIARVLLETPDYSGGPRFVNIDTSATPPLEACLTWPCAVAVGGFVRVAPGFNDATAPDYAVWSYGTLGITRIA